MKSTVVSAAERLRKGRDFAMLLAERLDELNGLILSTSLSEQAMIMQLLCQYHALRDFGDFVVATAEEAEIDRAIHG